MKFYWENIKYLFTPIPENEVLECDYSKYVEQIEALLAREQELLNKISQESHPKKVYWDEKHEEKIINYNGRNLPYTSERIKVDVRTFITPDDITVRRWVKRHPELVCDNPLRYDHLVRDFYLADREDFKYKFDEQTTNDQSNEVWLFPFELDAQGMGDCEDHSHRMKSRLNALGLPDWRSRVVCGTTRDGEGHSTVYYLADDLKTWVHLNSTTLGMSVGTTLPTINDENDGIGIGSVWFSFNKEKSWADFESPKDGEIKRFKYINIL